MTDMAALRAEQLRRAAEVIRYDDLPAEPPAFIAGADVGFEQEGGDARRHRHSALSVAGAGGVSGGTYRHRHALHPGLPVVSRIPGAVGRLGAAAAETGADLRRRARYFASAASRRRQPFRPAGRCANRRRGQKRLCGKFAPLDAAVGALAPLEDKGEQLGWVWRSKARCNPLFISTGHRVGADSALAWVQRCMAGYRLPEPTRWADAIASRRPAFQRWLQQHPEVSP